MLASVAFVEAGTSRSTVALGAVWQRFVRVVEWQGGVKGLRFLWLE